MDIIKRINAFQPGQERKLTVTNNYKSKTREQGMLNV